MTNPANKQKSFAKRLVSDDPTERKECLNELEQYVTENKLNEKDFRKIWKALFYSLWVADKVKIQLELSNKIAKLIHKIGLISDKYYKEWLKACFFILHKEWDNLDYNRANKFLTLIRIIITEIYNFIQKQDYTMKFLKTWNKIFIEEGLSENLATRSTGLILQILQVFVDSIIDLKGLTQKLFHMILGPIFKFASICTEKTIRKTIVTSVFENLHNALENGKFKECKIDRFLKYILKKASAKDIKEANRKILYEAYNMFNTLEKLKSDMVINGKSDNHHHHDQKNIDVLTKSKASSEKTQANEKAQASEKSKTSEKPKSNEKTKANQDEHEKGNTKEKKNKADLNDIEPQPKKKSKLDKLNEKEPAVAIKEKEPDAKKSKKEEKKVKTSKSNNTTKSNHALDDDDDEDDEDYIIDEDLEDEDLDDIGDDDLEEDEEGELEDLDDDDEEEEDDADEDEDDDDEDDEGDFEDFDDDDDEDAYQELSQDELDNLTQQEYMALLKKGLLGDLPEYLFQTPKEKKKYFTKLNKEYYDNLSKEDNLPDKTHAKHVKFNVAKHDIFEFDKTQKVSNDKVKHVKKLPSKGLLKKTPSHLPKNVKQSSSSPNVKNSKKQANLPKGNNSNASPAHTKTSKDKKNGNGLTV